MILGRSIFSPSRWSLWHGCMKGSRMKMWRFRWPGCSTALRLCRSTKHLSFFHSLGLHWGETSLLASVISAMWMHRPNKLMLAEMDYLAPECKRQNTSKCFEAIPGQTCAGRLNRTDDGSIIVSPLVALARAFKLQIHAYTFRNEVHSSWHSDVKIANCRLCLWHWTFYQIRLQSWNSTQTQAKELALMVFSLIAQRLVSVSFL